MWFLITKILIIRRKRLPRKPVLSTRGRSLRSHSKLPRFWSKSCTALAFFPSLSRRPFFWFCWTLPSWANCWQSRWRLDRCSWLLSSWGSVPWQYRFSRAIGYHFRGRSLLKVVSFQCCFWWTLCSWWRIPVGSPIFQKLARASCKLSWAWPHTHPLYLFWRFQSSGLIKGPAAWKWSEWMNPSIVPAYFAFPGHQNRVLGAPRLFCCLLMRSSHSPRCRRNGQLFWAAITTAGARVARRGWWEQRRDPWICSAGRKW